MRISLVHSFYASSDSGENQTVLAQHNSLRSAGHDVQLIRFDSQAQPSLWDKTAAAWRVSSGRGPRPEELIRSFEPDVVHVHNLFPNGPTRGWEANHVPMVVSLHNYRVLCANGLLLRDGKHCSACLQRGPREALRYACYKGSRLATAPLVVAQFLGWSAAAVLAVSDVVTLPSEAALRVFQDAGLADRRWKVQEPFLPRSEQLAWEVAQPERTAAAVAIGRLSPEKGFRELLAEWPQDWPLKIIGDGPEAEGLKRVARDGVAFMGRLPHGQVLEKVAAASCLVFPSTAMETFGLVYLEALSVGTPVIAREGTVVAELVSKHGTGYTYRDKYDLAFALQQVRDNGAVLSRRCVAVFLNLYSEEAWLTRAIGDYSEAQERYERIRGHD